MRIAYAAAGGVRRRVYAVVLVVSALAAGAAAWWAWWLAPLGMLAAYGVTYGWWSTWLWRRWRWHGVPVLPTQRTWPGIGRCEAAQDWVRVTARLVSGRRKIHFASISSHIHVNAPSKTGVYRGEIARNRA